MIIIEAEILSGFSAFHIVGLPSTSILESKERIRSAIHGLGLSMPPGRIIVNLYPGGYRKLGTHFDLPIAMALFGAMGKVNLSKLEEFAMVGELSLDGRLRPLSPALPLVIELRSLGKRRVILPESNLDECRQIEGVTLYPIKDLKEAYLFFRNEKDLPAISGACPKNEEFRCLEDYRDIRQQGQLKRVLQVAALGRHSLLLIGPPGVGKTMAMVRYPSLLPNLSYEQSLECSKIYAIAGLLEDGKMIRRPPFRSPHYSISRAGLLGGGNPPLPGEISLSQHGVLFLDELAEFPKSLLDLLRTPLENREVHLARSGKHWTYPADFQLMACMNPCPCGNHGHPEKECSCSPRQIDLYLAHLSRPMLDRIDLRLEMNSTFSEGRLQAGKEDNLSSQEMKERIDQGRRFQLKRMEKLGIPYNARTDDRISLSELNFSGEARDALDRLSSTYPLSMRSLRRLSLVARTIADLDQKKIVLDDHVYESFQYRKIEYKYWK